MAIMFAYGSYLPKTSNIARDAVIIALSDLGVSLLSSIVMFTTMGGILQFSNNEALILTPTSEQGENIDEVRANDALKRAKARLADNNANIDSKRAEAAVARAMARLKASMNNIKG